MFLVCLLDCLCLWLCFRALCFVFVFTRGVGASLTVLLVAVCGLVLAVLSSGFRVLWFGYEWLGYIVGLGGLIWLVLMVVCGVVFCCVAGFAFARVVLIYCGGWLLTLL